MDLWHTACDSLQAASQQTTNKENTMRTALLTSALAFTAVFGSQPTTAQAGDKHHAHGHGRHGSYFGNGGHDYQPHWHVTQTPFGARAWYGNGPHDFVPHQHSYSPWSYRGYSNTGAGPTTSFYPRHRQYYYAPW
jgi:hypothetical protein